MRAFLAFNIDTESIYKIKKIQDKINKELGINLKYTKQDQLHLTTFFLGNIDNDEKLKQIMKQINYPEKFTLTVNDLKFFPKDNFANVISLGFDKFELLDSFIKEQDTELEKLNYIRDKKWLPHITIARSKNKIKKFDFTLDSFNISFESLSLYQSTLTPKGSIYNELLSIKL